MSLSSPPTRYPSSPVWNSPPKVVGRPTMEKRMQWAFHSEPREGAESEILLPPPIRDSMKKTSTFSSFDATFVHYMPHAQLPSSTMCSVMLEAGGVRRRGLWWNPEGKHLRQNGKIYSRDKCARRGWWNLKGKHLRQSRKCAYVKAKRSRGMWMDILEQGEQLLIGW